MLEQQRNDVGRILEVGRENDDGIGSGLQQRVNRRSDVAEVARVDDHLDVAVGRRQLAQSRHRLVGRGVVDEDVLVPVSAEPVEDLLHLEVHVADVRFLVETGGDDADEAHGFSLDRAG